MKTDRSQKSSLCLCGAFSVFFLAFIVRLAFLAIVGFHYTDAQKMLDRDSSNILSGIGYVDLNNRPTAFFPPLYMGIYTLFRIIFGEHRVGAMLVFDCVVSAASVVVLYFLALRTLGKKQAMISGVAYAFYPFSVAYVVALHSTSLEICLSLLLLYLIIRGIEDSKSEMSDTQSSIYNSKSSILSSFILPPSSFGLFAGLSLGFLSLMRPMIIPLAIILPFVQIGSARNRGTQWIACMKSTMILWLVGGSIVGVWTVRNCIRLGEFVPVATNLGYNFAMGNNDESLGGMRRADGTTLEDLNFLPKDEKAMHANITSDSERDRYLFKWGWNYILAHPARFFRLVPSRLYYLFWFEDALIKESAVGRFAFGGKLSDALIYFLALGGLVRLIFTNRWRLIATPVAFILYHPFFYSFFFGQWRFRAHFMGILILLGSEFVVYLLGRLGKRRKSRRLLEQEQE